MNRGERKNRLSPISERTMFLYFGLPEIRRNKGIDTLGREALDILSEIDRAFLGYPHCEPQIGSFNFQVLFGANSFWVSIGQNGKRVRFSQEDDRKLIYHEIEIEEGRWMSQDPKECCDEDSVDFDRVFEGLVSIGEAKLDKLKP